ncbi:MAG: hypothetical protein H0V01_10630 [Bacteroidetes bacterium]|nr:hypothetical protein [Bacteroidota bacterium]HET6244807.1 hypothetical protein [Bacteroidia bacterium]
MVKKDSAMKTFDRNVTETAVMTLTGRQRNGRHASRPEKDLIFAPPHFKKEKKGLPPLNFLSRFLSTASFSTFAVYFLLCVEKITHNKKLAKPPTTKELNPAHKTKTRAKKFCLPAGASLTGLWLLTVLFSIDIFAQNIQTQKPQFESFEPVKSEHYFTTVPINQGYTYQTPQQNVPMGATAQDIINQSNSRAQGSVYTPNMTTQERQQANIKYIQQQMANDPAYQQPNKSNNFSQNINRKQQQEVVDILNEVHSTESSRRFNMNDYKSPEFSTKTKPYTDALQQLKDQLSGQ